MKFLVFIFFLASACRVGEGEGFLYGCLYHPSCGYGDATSDAEPDSDAAAMASCPTGEYNPLLHNYSLTPGFFAADTYDDGSMEIRIQKDGNWSIKSDGLIIIIPNYVSLSKQLDELASLELIFPPFEELESLPPSQRFKASYYLNSSCQGSYTGLVSGTGTLTLTALYRPDSDRTLIEASSFDLLFKDTRIRNPNEPGAWLQLRGRFKFEFARGLPAQYFPLIFFELKVN